MAGRAVKKAAEKVSRAVWATARQSWRAMCSLRLGNPAVAKAKANRPITSSVSRVALL